MFEHLSIPTVLVSYTSLLFSLSVHEASHASMAYVLGDDTAARQGRMSLNPIAHVDPLGTVVFPLMGLILGGFFIGWAKPVPFNPVNFTRKLRMKTCGALVSLAGPASNVVLGFLFLTIVCLSIRFSIPEETGRWKLFEATAQSALRGPEYLISMGLPMGLVLLLSLGGTLVLMNLLLAAFNILPLGPLDGAGVLRGMLPDSWLPRYDYYRYHRYTMPILFVLMLTGIIGKILAPVLMLFYWTFFPLAHIILGA